jgi:hypothetical protein
MPVILPATPSFHGCELAALTSTRTGARPADKCAHGWALPGNAPQYKAFVFNFARTWESIYLNFDLDAPP